MDQRRGGTVIRAVSPTRGWMAVMLVAAGGAVANELVPRPSTSVSPVASAFRSWSWRRFSQPPSFRDMCLRFRLEAAGRVRCCFPRSASAPSFSWHGPGWSSAW